MVTVEFLFNARRWQKSYGQYQSFLIRRRQHRRRGHPDDYNNSIFFFETAELTNNNNQNHMYNKVWNTHPFKIKIKI